MSDIETVVRNVTAPMYVSSGNMIYHRTANGDEFMGEVESVDALENGGFIFLFKKGGTCEAYITDPGTMIIWS